MQVDLESCCLNFGYSFQTFACFVLGYQKGKTFEKWRLVLLSRGSYLQYAVMCYHEYQLTYSVLQSCYLFSLLILILGLRGLWPPSFHPGNLEICNCIPSIFSEECSQKAGNKISDKKYFKFSEKSCLPSGCSVFWLFTYSTLIFYKQSPEAQTFRGSGDFCKIIT